MSILAASARAAEPTLCQKDLEFALEQIPQRAGELLKGKQIDWDAMASEFREDAKRVENDEQHLALLIRLMARLKDGHAAVRLTEKAGGIAYPSPFAGATGPGMFWCIIDDGVYVKNSWSSARAAGVMPGMRVLAVDDVPARQWLDQRLQRYADTVGHSTPQQALAWMCHWGLAAAPGTQLKLRVRDQDGLEHDCTVQYERASFVPSGPAVFPEHLQGDRDVRFGKLLSGLGYIHLRRCPADLPERIDAALSAIGDVPGLILDLRANGGGGFDHEALMGRFIPAGKRMAFAKAYVSAGLRPYGGPVVVIVDANCRSAGETLAAIFKEDSRAYLIGESATAGTSSQKTTIDLPSGLFSLYFSTRSNMQRTNGGAGIEGVGVPPHKIVQYDPQDLSAGTDTLIRHAEQLLARFPQEEVPYNPGDFGWRQNQPQP